jgi:hypothetical protein
MLRNPRDTAVGLPFLLVTGLKFGNALAVSMAGTDDRHLRAMRFLYVALKGAAETLLETNPIAGPLIKIGKTFYDLAELAGKTEAPPKEPLHLEDALHKLEVATEQLVAVTRKDPPGSTVPDSSYEKEFIELGLNTTIREITLEPSGFSHAIERAPLRLGNCDFFDTRQPLTLRLMEQASLKQYRVMTDAQVDFSLEDLILRFPSARIRDLRSGQEWDIRQEIRLPTSKDSHLRSYFNEREVVGQFDIFIRRIEAIYHRGSMVIAVPKQRAISLSFAPTKDPKTAIYTAYFCLNTKLTKGRLCNSKQSKSKS